MTRISKKDISGAVSDIETNARELGLISAEEKLHYTSSLSPYSATLDISGPDGSRRAEWLPPLQYKDGPQTQYKMLLSTAAALRGVISHQGTDDRHESPERD